MKKWLLLRGLAIPTLVVATTSAEEPDIVPAASICPPKIWRPPVCPPGTSPYLPPSKQDTPTDPMQMPPPPAGMTPDPLARAPEAGTQPAASLVPNMFGDQFGGTLLRSRIQTTRQLNFVLSGPNLSFGGVTNVDYFASGPLSALRFVPASTSPVVILQDNGGTRTFAAPTFLAATPFTRFPTTAPLQENSTVSSAIQSLNPAASIAFQSPGSNAMNGSIDSPYFIAQSYAVTTTNDLFGNAQILLPLPAAGGVVGRTKLSDDNSPLPRDRVILNADYFANTVLAPGGFDVGRFSPGIETTFLDRMASVEVRFPFASTVDPTNDLSGIASRSTQFGNVNVLLKALLTSSRTVNVAAGVGFSLPTGPGSTVRGTDGRDVLRVTNDSWIFSPYVAALFTPGDRFFAQLWSQVSVDTTGSRVFFDPGTGADLVGRLYDQTILATDLQLGYWLIRNDANSMLRGFAPFVEVHYNTTISDARAIQAGSLTIGALGNRMDEWNLTVGAAAQIGTNLIVNCGLVLPLRGNDNRTFDYQVGLRASWFFGPTAEAREAAETMGARSDAPAAGESAMPPSAMEAPVDAMARAPETGTQPAATLVPGFFGDFQGANTRVSASPNRIVQIPVLPRYAGMKVSDNDGPRPSDRIFFSYNSYSGVNSSVNPEGTPDISFRRQIIGLETTVGSSMSIGARLPFLQASGLDSIEDRQIGDVSLTSKYTIRNDVETGNLMTVGAIVTLPTGGRGEQMPKLNDGSRPPRSLFLQPWIGSIWNFGNAYIQETTGILLPADPVYPTALFNSIGAGYWIYKNADDSIVRGVAPVIEIHASRPLTNTHIDAPIFFRHQINLTAGVNVQFPRLSFGAALCVPLVGPKPYDLEGMFTMNYQF